jgi:hypothetical protein
MHTKQASTRQVQRRRWARRERERESVAPKDDFTVVTGGLAGAGSVEVPLRKLARVINRSGQRLTIHVSKQRMSCKLKHSNSTKTKFDWRVILRFDKAACFHVEKKEL